MPYLTCKNLGLIHLRVGYLLLVKHLESFLKEKKTIRVLQQTVETQMRHFLRGSALFAKNRSSEKEIQRLLVNYNRSPSIYAIDHVSNFMEMSIGLERVNVYMNT